MAVPSNTTVKSTPGCPLYQLLINADVLFRRTQNMAVLSGQKLSCSINYVGELFEAQRTRRVLSSRALRTAGRDSRPGAGRGTGNREMGANQGLMSPRRSVRYSALSTMGFCHILNIKSVGKFILINQKFN